MNNMNNKSNKSIVKNTKRSTFLDKQDALRILNEFPKIELSYEAVVHNKVPSNCMSLIPDGRNCFAWFTIYNDHNVCFLIDIQRNSVELVTTSFAETLSIGTILRGILFYSDDSTNVKMFAIEDICLYKGETISSAKYSTVKFNIYKNMLKNEMGKHAFTSKCLIFGLPIMHSNYDELMFIARTQTLYRVKYIQFGTIDKHGSNKMIFTTHSDVDAIVKPIVVAIVKPTVIVIDKPKHSPLVQTFAVSPDIQPDIYFLVKNGKDYGVACIPNYATSVMMNKLFRNLKENDNLDALEESDDEEEFENENPHKFVHLERTLNMLCYYNEKFKKWVPMQQTV